MGNVSQNLILKRWLKRWDRDNNNSVIRGRFMKSIIQTVSLSLIESVTVVLNEAKLLAASITPNLIWNASLDFFLMGNLVFPWRHIDSYLENGVSKSIVHVIKHANFQLHRVHPDGVTSKTWQLTNEFDFLYIKRCVQKKKLLVRHNKVSK